MDVLRGSGSTRAMTIRRDLSRRTSRHPVTRFRSNARGRRSRSGTMAAATQLAVLVVSRATAWGTPFAWLRRVAFITRARQQVPQDRLSCMFLIQAMASSPSSARRFRLDRAGTSGRRRRETGLSSAAMRLCRSRPHPRHWCRTTCSPFGRWNVPIGAIRAPHELALSPGRSPSTCRL
jgi:hypothetical protein